MNKFLDNRGKLLFLIKNSNYNFNECTVSINNKDVFRGIHINQFDKLITCISGKILDIVINFNIDEEDYLIPKYYNLDPNTNLYQLYIKKNYGHAFLSLEDNSILVYHFTGIFNENDTKHIHWKDPLIQLKLPIEFPILSDKDNIKNFIKPIDYIIFGSTGFLGQNIIKYLKLFNKNYIICSLRLEQVNEIIKYIELYNPKYVINCAGLTGIPNIFWCDEHRLETIETNITYQLTLSKICNDKNIHLTIFGSGGIFNDNKFYDENDMGNFNKNFYSQCRIYLENIINNYSNVLYLRINYPISCIKHDKNLLTKLLGYKFIENVEISITYIDNLFPILLTMIENKEIGICNFINPGSISLSNILNIYNNFNNIINNFNIVEKSNNNRSYSKLKCEKLLKYNPMNIKEAITECCSKYQSILLNHQ